MRGFTIIESIITITVVGIMASIILASYGPLRERIVLNRYIREVALDVRKAQNLTTSIVKQSDGSAPCGYGIHYKDQYNYVVFANNRDGSEDNCADSSKIYDALDEVVSEKKLDETHLRFSGSFLDIVFLPPDPLIFIDGSSNPTDQSVITVCIARDCSSLRKQIVVYGSGLIDIR